MIRVSCIAPPYLPGVPPCPGHPRPPIPIKPPVVIVLPVEPSESRGLACV